MLMAAHGHDVPHSPPALSALNDTSVLLPRCVSRQVAAAGTALVCVVR